MNRLLGGFRHKEDRRTDTEIDVLIAELTQRR